MLKSSLTELLAWTWPFFCVLRKDKHFQTSPKYPGLNLSLARRAFKKLIKKDDVLAEVCMKNFLLNIVYVLAQSS